MGPIPPKHRVNWGADQQARRVNKLATLALPAKPPSPGSNPGGGGSPTRTRDGADLDEHFFEHPRLWNTAISFGAAHVRIRFGTEGSLVLPDSKRRNQAGRRFKSGYPPLPDVVIR